MEPDVRRWPRVPADALPWIDSAPMIEDLHIEVPPSVYREMGGRPPAGLFAAGPVVEVV